MQLQRLQFEGETSDGEDDGDAVCDKRLGTFTFPLIECGSITYFASFSIRN